MKVVSFSLEQGNRYFGRIDGQRFAIGRRVPFDGRKGLMNVSGTPAQRYDRAEYRARHGFWADFIHPTASAEGALFHTLNTYDRARFTFAFLQFAAHVPNGDFVAYFRALLQLPLAPEYFPDLAVRNGRICRLGDDGETPLESDTSTAGLMDYLNPGEHEVEDTEVIQAARFVHWVQNDPLHRQVQVEVGLAHIRNKMHRLAQRYGLDGKDDRICLLVADISHQGRAKAPVILTALAAADPFTALLRIGEDRYPARIATLRREIKSLVAEGTLGLRRYDVARADFVLA
jgi:hypothetical protein